MTGFGKYTTVGDLPPGALVAWNAEQIGPFTIQKPMRVIDVRVVPEIDRTEEDQPPATSLPTFRKLPYYLQIEDLATGERHHYRIRGGYQRGFEVLPEHYAVCTSCGGLWPCRENIIGIHVRAEAQRLGRACVVCGKDDGWRIAEVRVDTPDRVAVQRFHTRKGTPCRTAYLKAIDGDEAALTRLKNEDLMYAVQADKTRGRRGRR